MVVPNRLQYFRIYLSLRSLHRTNKIRYAEGTAVEDLTNPDRVLIGGEQTEAGKAAIQVCFDTPLQLNSSPISFKSNITQLLIYYSCYLSASLGGASGLQPRGPQINCRFKLFLHKKTTCAGPSGGVRQLGAQGANPVLQLVVC